MFGRSEVPAFIGVVHLPPLPGAPAPSPGFANIRERALADARALADGGADGVILENFGDAPFERAHVSPFTVAIMTRLALAIRSDCPRLSLGINVLRNDALSGLGIAAASDADFIRVNVFTGVTATDQGIIEGPARQLHLERNRLGARVQFAADVHVKHGFPLNESPIEQAAEDTRKRGMADALILSGDSTGKPTSLETIQRVRHALPNAPLWIGSGFQPEQLEHIHPMVDAIVVGTWLRSNDLANPISIHRVQALRDRLSKL